MSASRVGGGLGFQLRGGGRDGECPAAAGELCE